MTKQVLKFTEEQIQFFKEQVHLRLERITPPEELEFLKGA
jgi:hypothetical protein